MPEASKLRVLPPKPDKKLMVETWAKQSELMWRTTYATPAIATAIFAGWYIVWKDSIPSGRFFLANSVLGAGALMMVVQGLIVHRMTQYLNRLRQAAHDALPYVPPTRFRKVRLMFGYELALLVPFLLAAMFAAMLAISILGL